MAKPDKVSGRVGMESYTLNKALFRTAGPVLFEALIKTRGVYI